MARIEKTVFISYRRTDISWALAVYQYLASQKYDVFFDYTHIPSGDFEQIIVSNIKARAHFVLILTPTALNRTSNEGDWLRREIETAIDEKRNIIPLFFDGFSFGFPNLREKLTGKMANISRYNGLDIPSGYFPEAMERLSTRYLNTPLNAVIHPVSIEVRKKIREEKVAANKALREQKTDIKELVKPAQEKLEKPKQVQISTTPKPQGKPAPRKVISWKLLAGITGVLALILLSVWGSSSLWNTLASSPSDPVKTEELQLAATDASSPEFSIGSTMVGSDDTVLLYVPAGEFIMGSENGDNDEKPVHAVYLDAFWIDQAEVSNSNYKKCIDAGVCIDPPSGSPFFDDDYIDHPVVLVSWEDANAYCLWTGRRLPTEAEWEKAASWDYDDTEKNTYPWGENPTCQSVNYNLCQNDTAIVISYENSQSPYGAFNMGGNVWEWVADFYDSEYYTHSDYHNPLGPENGASRVLRGGSWRSSLDGIRTSNRFFSSEKFEYFVAGFGRTNIGLEIGFRCAMDAE